MFFFKSFSKFPQVILASFIVFSLLAFFSTKIVFADFCSCTGGCGTCSATYSCYDNSNNYYSYADTCPTYAYPTPAYGYPTPAYATPACATNYWSCQGSCGSWGGQYCDSCGSCGACDAYCPPVYATPPYATPPYATPPGGGGGGGTSCSQYFSCVDIRCADGSLAPGVGCYSPDRYYSECVANCVSAGNGAPGTGGSGGGSGGGGGGASGACPDDCFSDDLRTNVQRNPSTGACDSGYSSTSHYCNGSNRGSTQSCNGGSYTCTRGGTGHNWVPSGNAAGSGYTNTWRCDDSGGFYICQGGSQTNCTPGGGGPGGGSTPPPGGGYQTPPYISPPLPPTQAWWQVKDADIAAAGDIRSVIPSTCTGSCSAQLSLPGSGGFPGVPSYSGSSSLGSGSFSSNGWAANTSYSGRRYDYDWYSSLSPGDTEKIDCAGGCTVSGGDIVAKAISDKTKLIIYDGNTTITSDVNLGNKKIAMFVNGNLDINGKINLDRGSGFYMAITKGNIVVASGVTNGASPALEGLFVSDGQFSTGAGSSRLYVRGSVVAWNGVVLQRDLGSSSNQAQAAETFEYAPDLVLNFPKQLFREGIVWREIAP